ncbi:MAG: hypothetical protein IKR61_08610 [Lachnospiraceae bacterium]|nr:hypothetical protein [Lachnospiraceae bacterium]
MKIESSNIGMESARSYYTSKITYRRFELTDYSNMDQSAAQKEGEAAEEDGKDSFRQLMQGAEEGISSLQNWVDHLSSIKSNYKLRNPQEQTAETIRLETLKYIFEQLFEQRRKRLMDLLGGEGISCTGSSLQGAAGSSAEAAPAAEDPTGLQAQGSTKGLQTLYYTETTEYYEREEVSFLTNGTVRCADGREISFGVNVGMSRECSEYFRRDLGQTLTTCVDPLVINLDGNVTAVSDQTFFFDIDSDGKQDEISSLKEGSGFLALDLNGDGRIGDGSELFGTKSGDGFADLAAYDGDRNGWIDENDDIWDKLRVWVRREDGSEKLYDLKEAGVGALCLQRLGTDFSLQDQNRQDRAYIRSTGVFLYENGSAGTLQHVDLVKYAKEA